MTGMSGEVETCTQCGMRFVAAPDTHAEAGQAEEGLIMAGFCSEACADEWFRQDRIVRLNLELMEDLGMETHLRR